MKSPLPLLPENIPTALKGRKQWVLWRYEERDGEDKPTKIPYMINGRRASSKMESTWSNFDEVLTIYEDLGGYDGIGYILAAKDPFTGIDLDDVVEEDGTIEAAARDIVEQLNSYTEISPSGEGLRIFIKAQKPGPRCRTGSRLGFEVYDGKRLLSLTGNRLPDTPETIEERQVELEKLYNEIFPEKEAPHVKAQPGKSTVGDGELLGKILASKQAKDFVALWDGDVLHHPSASEADLVFCNILAFWTGRDEAQMDRLFRASGRMRPKWDEKRGRQTYGEMTISKAISDTTEVYTPTENGTDDARQISEEELAAMKMDNGPSFELNLPRDHYLTHFIAYGEDVSDAYPDYWFAGGLYQLAVIADKKMWVKLRQGPIYPNLYIFIAGRSSLSRKSTVVDISESLLNDHRPGTAINAVPTEFSPEAFIEHLDECPHAPWVRDEAAGVLSTMRRDYMRGFKDSLMQLYDCRPIHRKLRTNRRSKSKTDFVVDDPYLNVLWATTDSSLAANTEINDTLSGFMARFIYHFPRRPKERWLPLEEGEAMNSELEFVVNGQLATMANKVAEMVRRQLKFSKESSQYWTQWQKQRAGEIEKRDDANEMQIHSRLVPLVAKLSMLFELGSSDFDPDRPIRPEYVAEACRLVDEYYQPMAMAVYDMVGRDLEKNVIDRIIAFLKRHGGVSTKRELSRHVKIKAKELQEYLDTMAGDGTIEYCMVENPGGGIPTIKVVLNVDTDTTVTRDNSVTTVTSNTEDKQKENNTQYDDSSSSCVEDVTNDAREPGDIENPRDIGDTGDSRDSRLSAPNPQDVVLGLSLAYYKNLGGGQLPTLRALMDDQGWDVEKAKMAIALLVEREGVVA